MNRKLTLVLALSVWSAGCQAYAPFPLNDDAHQEEWASRTAGSERVKDFAAHLATLNPGRNVPFDLSDHLSLSEAESVALVFNPGLKTARLKAKVPLMGAKEAGRWDDPELDIDLLRIMENVKDPWIIGSSLSFTIPISGRLALEKDKAFADADVELRRAMLAEWMLLGELRAAWVRWSGTLQRVVLIEAYLQQLDQVVALAQKQRDANRIGVPQLRVLQLERVSRYGELESLRVGEERQRVQIKALMGLHPNAPLQMEPTLSLEPLIAPVARLAQLREHNLNLTVARAEYQVSEHALRLEIRKQFPDLVIGPGYENEEGVSRAGVVLSVPIPLLNQNRRAIAEARAARDAAKAAYEAEYERLIVALSEAELAVRGARTRSDYLEQKVAPMVDQQMQDLQRLANLGDLDVLVILDALTRTFETKSQVLDAKVEEVVALTELQALLRPLKTPQSQEIQDAKE